MILRLIACTARRTRATVPAVLALVALPMPAFAQLFGNPLLQSEVPSDYDRGRNISVLDRSRPEYEARGVQYGPVLLRPRLRASAGFTSNVNGTNAARRADAYVIAAPEIAAETEALIDNITLGAGADIQKFARTPDRDQTGYFLSASARHRPGRDTGIFALADLRRYYEQNISTGIPADAAEPVAIDFARGNLRVERSVSRLQFTAMGEARKLDFRDVATLGGGIFDQDFRDRDEYLVAGRVTYAATPETSAFIEAAGTRIAYALPLAPGIANRDANQLRLLAGINLDIGALVRGRFGGGYVTRSFDSPLYGSLNGVVADARVQLFPSQITTITLSARRYAGESAINTAPGYFGNGARAEIDHELLRNLLLNASVDYEDDRYTRSTRRDAAMIASAGARYFVSRSLGFGGQASFLRRRSRGEQSIPDFNDFRLLLSIVAQR